MAMVAAGSSNVSASFRVPRPPALFVGRAEETAWLRDRLEAGGVAIVAGLGGFGKTALACHMVEEIAPVCAAFVALRSGSRLVLETARAVTARAGYRLADWSMATREPMAMMDSLVDLADEHDVFVVLDDLHEAGGDVGEALTTIARRAQRSRWLVTTRRRLDVPGLEDRTLLLDALPAAAIEDIVRSCAPRGTRADHSRAVQGAGGSPWRARRLARRAATTNDPATEVSEEAWRALDALALVHVPIERDTLCRAADIEPTHVEELLRNGLVEDGGRGVEVHDLAREHGALVRRPAEAGRAARLGELLLVSTEPEVQLEGARLLVEAGRADDALATARELAEAWIDAGFAERVASLAEASGGAGSSLRMRAARALGAGRHVAWALAAPRPDDLAVQLVWAEIQVQSGRFGEAIASARHVFEAAQDERLRVEAALVLAEGLRFAGRTREALEALAIDAHDDELSALVRLRQARLRVLQGEVDAGVALADRVECPPSLAPAARVRIELTRWSLLSFAGRIVEAGEVGRRLDRSRHLAPLLGAEAIARRCAECIHAGDLAQAEALLRRGDDGVDERIGRRGREDGHELEVGSPVRVRMLLNEVLYRFAFGAFGPVRDRISLLLEEAQRFGNAELLAPAQLAATYERMLRVDGITTSWPAALPAQRNPSVAMGRAHERIVARRAGAPLRPPLAPSEAVDARIAQLRDEAEDLAFAGRHEDAQATWSAALQLAEQHRYAYFAAELLVLGGDLLLIGAGPDRLARARGLAHALEARAEAMGSPRFRLEASMLSSAAQQQRAPARWQELAELGDVSPLVARRAGALLGRDVLLDGMDRRVLASDAFALAGASARMAVALPRERTWRLDPEARRVHLPDRVVDLRGHALYVRLLAYLATRDDHRASKEELARDVWDITDYHPLRDDKRVHVAVRRMRVLLEEDPSRPERVLTVEDGYALRRFGV